jgi:hypothetical protein
VFVRVGWKSLPGTKHSSLLQKFVNYGRKKFYNIVPGQKDSTRLERISDPDKISIKPLKFQFSENFGQNSFKIFQWPTLLKLLRS